MQKMCNTDAEGRWYVFFMFTFFPLFVIDGYSNITLTKCLTFVVLICFFALTLLVNYGSELASGKRPQILVKRAFSSIYFPDWLLLLMLFFTVLSCVFSPYFGTKNSDGLSLLIFGAGRYDGILFLFFYMLIFWLCARHGKFGQWLTFAFVITTGILCVISIVQLSGINAFGLYPNNNYNGYYDSFVATLGNVDMMAGYLCMAWPLAWVGYIVLPFNSNGNLPKFIQKQDAKDITEAYLFFEKYARYVFLPVLGLSIYVGLQIGVELFKVTLVAVLFVMIPLLTRSLKNICRLLESMAVIVLSIGMSNAVTYTYLRAESRTKTEFEFTVVLAICLCVSVVLLGGSVLIRSIKSEREKNAKKSNKHKNAKKDKILIEQNKKSKVFLYISLGVLGVELLCLVGAFCYLRFFYTPTVKYGFMHDLYELVRGRISDTAGSHRGIIWKSSLKMSKDNFLLGTGPGTFAKSFNRFTLESGYTYYEHKNVDFAHNEYIHILCTTGILGLVSYLGFLISTAYLSFKTIAKNPKVIVLGAAVLGYTVQAFFSFSVVIMTPIFWVLIGLLVKEARDTLDNNIME